MNDVTVWITYHMARRGEIAESGIRLRMTRETYEKLKAGEPVRPVNAICQAFALLAGYQYGEYVSFCDVREIPGDTDDPGVPDCEECRLSGLITED